MKILVIGANAAGMSFSAKYHRLNPNDQLIVLEQRDYISFGGCGLPYYISDHFNDQNTMIARTPEQIIESGIDLRINSHVQSVDFENKTVEYKQNDQVINQDYDKLFICSGANPIVPNIIEGSSDDIHTLTTMDDGNKLKAKFANSKYKNITIIGAGFIGLEIMEAAIEKNKNVTVIEMNNHILNNQYNEEFSNLIEKHITNNNVNLKLNKMASKIETENGLEIHLDSEVIKADLIIMSSGFRPNTNFVDGIDKLRNGAIIVDQDGKTSIEDVYSIGDCASTYNFISKQNEYIPLATNANKFAKSVAEKLNGDNSTFVGMIGSSCIKVLDYQMARTGLTKKQAEDLNINFKENIVIGQNHTAYYEGQIDIHINLIYNADTLVIIGAEIIGQSDVVNRLNTLALAITKGVTTKELAYIDFAYSPPFNKTWDILNIAGSVSN